MLVDVVDEVVHGGTVAQVGVLGDAQLGEALEVAVDRRPVNLGSALPFMPSSCILFRNATACVCWECLPDYRPPPTARINPAMFFSLVLPWLLGLLLLTIVLIVADRRHNRKR